MGSAAGRAHAISGMMAIMRAVEDGARASGSVTRTWADRSWPATAVICGAGLIGIVFSWVAFWRDTGVSVPGLLFLLVAPLIGRWPLSWRRGLLAAVTWLAVGILPPVAYAVGFGLALAGFALVLALPAAYAINRAWTPSRKPA